MTSLAPPAWASVEGRIEATTFQEIFCFQVTSWSRHLHDLLSKSRAGASVRRTTLRLRASKCTRHSAQRETTDSTNELLCMKTLKSSARFDEVQHFLFVSHKIRTAMACDDDGAAGIAHAGGFVPVPAV